MDITRQYWKYSLIFLVIFLGIIIFRESLPFLSGILGAFTIYILVRKQMIYLTVKKKMRSSIAAILILVEVLLCFLIPAFLAFWLLITKLQQFDLNFSNWLISIQDFVNRIQDNTGYNIMNTNNITTVTTYATKILQTILGEVSFFVINAFILLFVLYFMLIGCQKMEAYLYEIMPFNPENKNEVLHEVNIMVKSNAIGIPLLAIIQGIIATVGYFIFGTPEPIVFGFLTCFATIIPLLGTALVWAPLCLYLGLTGNWPNAIGLAAYGLIVVSNVDNLVRFMLQKKLADIHPLITIFGVIIGLTLFGFWGVIFGPLLISMFLLCFNMFKKEYLDKGKTKE